MIKAIIFDWGGVLIDNPPPVMHPYLAKVLGADEELFVKEIKKYEYELYRGTIAEDELWRKVCGELKIGLPKTESLWYDGFKHAYVEKKEVFGLASDLKGKGYKTCFLSNTEIPSMNFFHEQGYDMFDVIVFSCDVGFIKPEKEIFELALEKLGVKAEEAVFIDDVEKYLEGARKVGIKTILFKSPEQVKDELRNLGVKI